MEGYYFDPKHGGCLRTVRRTSNDDYLILGVYGSDEACEGPWHAHATRLWGNVFRVDFAGKAKRRRFLRCALHSRHISWDDGNVWKRLFVDPTQLVQ